MLEGIRNYFAARSEKQRLNDAEEDRRVDTRGRRGALKAIGGAVLGGFAAAKMAEAGVTDTAVNILLSRERAKTEIERIKAREFENAVSELCRFLENSVANSERISANLLSQVIRSGKPEVVDSDPVFLKQFEDSVYISKEALSALKAKVKENRPVLDESRIKPGKTERLGAMAAIGAAIGGRAVGNREIERAGRDAQRASERMTRERVQRERDDRYAGMRVEDIAIRSITRVQRRVSELYQNLMVLNNKEITRLLEDLRNELRDSSVFPADMLDTVHRNPGRERLN